jgi:hypothetical protein
MRNWINYVFDVFLFEDYQRIISYLGGLIDILLAKFDKSFGF